MMTSHPRDSPSSRCAMFQGDRRNQVVRARAYVTALGYYGRRVMGSWGLVSALSLGERVDRDGAFISRGGPGEGFLFASTTPSEFPFGKSQTPNPRGLRQPARCGASTIPFRISKSASPPCKAQSPRALRGRTGRCWPESCDMSPRPGRWLRCWSDESLGDFRRAS